MKTISFDVRQRLKRIADSGAHPGSNRNMMLTPYDAAIILAALGAEDVPFGYWIEQKHAEPALLRKPAYIPEPSALRTVTPLYARAALHPSTDAAAQPTDAGVVVPRKVIAFLKGTRSLDGNWFGDPQPVGERGKFWWRRHLPDVAATPDGTGRGSSDG